MPTKKDALRKLMRARTTVMTDQPWFGTQLMNLQLVAGDGQSVDGTRLTYDPAWVMDRPDATVRFMLMHEVLHCALRHCYRRNGRNFEMWNQACDYVVNGMLATTSRVEVPQTALYDPQYSGKTAEQVFTILQKQQEQSGGQGQPEEKPDGANAQSQGGSPQPGKEGNRQDDQTDSAEGEGDGSTPNGGQSGQGRPQRQDDGGKGAKPSRNSNPHTGDVLDAPQKKADNTAQDWDMIQRQAEKAARQAGKLPAFVTDLIKALEAYNQVDWVAALREYMQRLSPMNYTWTRPSRRTQGVILPGLVRDQLGTVAVAVDTSGSISNDEYRQFRTEVEAILQEAQPQRIIYLEADAAVQHCEELQPGDALPEKRHGRGGTRFIPVFERLEEENPTVLLYLTDGFCSDKPATPDYPVVWVLTESGTKEPFEFGETLRLRAS